MERNLTWHNMDIDRTLREQQMGQNACTIWMSGLSGAGKSTIANALEKRLYAMGKKTMLLDGDNVRMGLNSNLGFSDEDRIENIRRTGRIAEMRKRLLEKDFGKYMSVLQLQSVKSGMSKAYIRLHEKGKLRILRELPVLMKCRSVRMLQWIQRKWMWKHVWIIY